MSQHQSVRILQACGLIFALLVFALAVACGSGGFSVLETRIHHRCVR